MTPTERSALAIQLNFLSERMDAQHASVKEDLTEIKANQDKTNGQVGVHTQKISKLEGGVLVIAAGLPVIVGLVVFALQQILPVR